MTWNHSISNNYTKALVLNSCWHSLICQPNSEKTHDEFVSVKSGLSWVSAGGGESKRCQWLVPDPVKLWAPECGNTPDILRHRPAHSFLAPTQHRQTTVWGRGGLRSASSGSARTCSCGLQLAAGFNYPGSQIQAGNCRKMGKLKAPMHYSLSPGICIIH